MARLGTQRVNDVLDYERDIKGKGLIRLRAGVGAGKNFWVRELPGLYPELQILMITSRKNVAEAEALKLGVDNRIHVNRLIDTNDREWYTDLPGSLIVCTNGYIEYFLKNIYDPQNSDTHLWNKFDVVFIDEAHSLTSDASFADSSFHVAQFVRHVRTYNPRCDVVMMSGTQDPINWMFCEDFLGENYTMLDLYDQCIHLVPDIVSLMKKEVVAERIFNIWSHNKRLIYFANSVASMTELINKLVALGVPEQDMAVAFSNSPNGGELPRAILEKKDAVRQYLVEHDALRPDIKIFLTTTQNKEGVSIIDDDIRYMFSENHNKADLEQMAGRVRGNPDTGTGIHALAVIYDAEDHKSQWSFLECEADRALVSHVDGIMDMHRTALKKTGMEYVKAKDIHAIQSKHRYLRYDYIQGEFCHFTGREQCERQIIADRCELDSYMGVYDQILYYYSDHSGNTYAVTGRTKINDHWFPYSKVHLAPDCPMGPKETATNAFLQYLQQNNLIEVEITSEQEAAIIREIHRLITLYGRQQLGFKKFPKSLKPALGRFNMTCEAASHHNTNKIIRLTRQS